MKLQTCYDAKNGIIITHYDKATKIAHKAIEMLNSGLYPFDKENEFPELILPQNIKANTLDHRKYLFWAVGMDSGAPSIEVYEGARKMVEQHGTKNIFSMKKKSLREMVQQNITGGVTARNNPVEAIYFNNNLLKQKYDGDPINIFKTNDVNEIIENICQFKSYGKGKSCLLIKNYVKFGYYTPENPFDYPIKPDRHTVRISLSAGAITTEPQGIYRRDFLEDITRDLYRKVTSHEKIDPGDLNNAFWGIGSKLCFKRSLSACKYYNCTLDCEFIPRLDTRGTFFDTRKNQREETPSLFAHFGLE